MFTLCQDVLNHAIPPEALKIRINQIKSLSNDVLLMNCAEKQDCEKIKKYINELENFPLVAQDERKKYPTIILKKVESTLSDQQIIQCLISQNIQEDAIVNLQASDIAQPKIVFKRNVTPQYMDVVIRAHPKLYRILIKNRRLFISYTSVKVEPFILLTQCYKL